MRQQFSSSLTGEALILRIRTPSNKMFRKLVVVRPFFLLSSFLHQCSTALKKYERPKMKRDARQKLGLLSMRDEEI